MRAQDQVVMPTDVRIVPLFELPPEIRARLGEGDGDFVITRMHSRVPSKVIDADSAALLKLFDRPKTLVEAITEYSQTAKRRPLDVLEDAYPVIESCIFARLLVEPGEASHEIAASFEKGQSVNGLTIESVIQALEDSEVYRVRNAEGRIAALKVSRIDAGPHIETLLRREENILHSLDGCVGPRLLGSGGLADGRRYLLTEWIEALEVQVAAARIRARSGPRLCDEMADLCIAVIGAYAALHEKRVIHADVHPRNVLVTCEGKVRLVDFGLARLESEGDEPVPRAGVGFFLEPEYAVAMRDSCPLPPATELGEQYAVAALVYLLITNSHYADFSFEKDEMMRQIASADMIPLSRRGIERAHSLDLVLRRALSKEPKQRFPDMASFLTAFRVAVRDREGESEETIAISLRARHRTLDWILAELSNPGQIPNYRGPAAPTASVTYGAAGIALGLLRIAQVRDDETLATIADSWAESAATELSNTTACYSEQLKITPEAVGRVSPYHTPSGVAAVQVLLAHTRGDLVAADRALGNYLESSRGDCDNLDLTLGRSSVLLGLSLLLEVADKSNRGLLLQRGSDLLDGIWNDLDCEPVIGERANPEYLGIAHGWAGYLYAALQWQQSATADLRASWQERLEQLARLASQSRRGARWAVQTGPNGDSVPGWCNGTAGHALLWTLAAKVYEEDRYLELAIRAAHDAFEGGGAGHSLCCGEAGQGYAQLAVYNATGDKQWLRHAQELAERAADTGATLRTRGEDVLPYSLYKGELGVAVLAAELERPAWASMPFFALEGWARNAAA